MENRGLSGSCTRVNRLDEYYSKIDERNAFSVCMAVCGVYSVNGIAFYSEFRIYVLRECLHAEHFWLNATQLSTAYSHTNRKTELCVLCEDLCHLCGGG